MLTISTLNLQCADAIAKSFMLQDITCVKQLLSGSMHAFRIKVR